MATSVFSPSSSPIHRPMASPQIGSNPRPPILFSSPDKREHPSSPLSSSDDQRPKRVKSGHPRNTRLISLPLESRLGSFATQSERQKAAYEAAQHLEKVLCLPTESTHVSLRIEPPSSQSEIYDHTNDMGWENSQLQTGGLKSQIRLSLRVFLDAFYAVCGYRPVWEQQGNQKSPQILQTVFDTREDAVSRSMEMLEKNGIFEHDIIYLVGRHSLYKENHQWIHDQPIGVIGAALSKFCREVISERRKAYQLAWTFLTGYPTFEVDEDDSRWMGTDGVTEDYDLVNETPDKSNIFSQRD